MTSTTPEDKGKGLVCVASIRERVHIVQCMFIDDSVRPINEPITFPRIDSKGVILPHEVALVLTLGVNGFDLHRILINLGSSANLLQMSAYRQIRYPPSTLENPDHILIGFNKATIVSLGNIVIVV